MKKIFLLLITLVMVVPSMARTLYLHPNANWMQQGGDGGDPQQFSVPRFAAYVWDENGNQWFDMVPAEEGFYKVEVPDNYVNIIFTRMTPFVKDNDWAQKWNQTADLTIGENNCYYVEENTWDKGNGSWGMYNALYVDVTDMGYATLFADYAVSLPEGVTAYTGMVNADQTVLTLQAVEGKVLPAKTAVVLEAAANKYLFVRSYEEVAPVEGNVLKGSWMESERPAGSIIFTLQLNENNEPGFYLYTGEKLNANRAYLEFPEGSNVQGLRISMGDVSGIDQVENAAARHTIYDLSGRAVKQVKQSGVYIVNGQKVFVK